LGLLLTGCRGLSGIAPAAGTGLVTSGGVTVIAIYMAASGTLNQRAPALGAFLCHRTPLLKFEVNNILSLGRVPPSQCAL
jgi:hypothetical protein